MCLSCSAASKDTARLWKTPQNGVAGAAATALVLDANGRKDATWKLRRDVQGGGRATSRAVSGGTPSLWHEC